MLGVHIINCYTSIYICSIRAAILFSIHMYFICFFQNYPLFIKTIPTENELKFYYTVHTSLDVVEEKISSVGKNANDLRELYLGLLYPTEDYKVYPFSSDRVWVSLVP